MNEWLDSHFVQYIRQTSNGMLHGGLPAIWVVAALLGMGISVSWLYLRTDNSPTITLYLKQLPTIGTLLQRIFTSPRTVIVLRTLVMLLFMLVIAAGLFGSAIPERNLATMLTWTIWWTCVIIVIYFSGSSWCAICPWDTLANWLVKQRIWFRAAFPKGLDWRVPKFLRHVWPASMMFIALTWLELGLGITTSPYATAVLALIMVTLATLALLFFERKAFCRYFCSVGRTIGAYSELSPVALRPINPDICVSCKTLDCYHGNNQIESCPTHLVIGRTQEMRYCTSCGACAISCPYHNVGWRWHSQPVAGLSQSRINSSEAWFILILMSLTSFHGITMLPSWESWVSSMAIWLNDRGQLLITFSVLMLLSMAIPILIYTLTIKWIARSNPQHEFARLFNHYAICLLPIAFSYHIAHNLTHLVRESRGFMSVLFNPFGWHTLPLTMAEKHERHMQPLLSNDLTYSLQTLLIIIGFYWAMRLYRQRPLHSLLSHQYAWPMAVFITGMCLFNLWLLVQPMVMRM